MAWAHNPEFSISNGMRSIIKYFAVLGSLSKDDGNAATTSENNDLIGRMSKNNRAARAARTLVQFFDIVC